MLILHVAFMIIGLGLIITAVTIARFFKDRKWWLKVHRIVAPAGSIFAILGLASGILMVSGWSSVHFRVPHAYLGLITIIFLLTTPILGTLQFRVRSRMQQIRIVHRWFGRSSIVLMVVTMMLGLFQAGVL